MIETFNRVTNKGTLYTNEGGQYTIDTPDLPIVLLWTTGAELEVDLIDPGVMFGVLITNTEYRRTAWARHVDKFSV